MRGFVGGQGCGKSKIGAYDLLVRVRPGRLYMVVSATYPMLRDSTFRTFREVAEHIGAWLPGRYNRTEFTCHIRTRWGGTAEVLFRSGDDPDRLRGPNVSGLWMDEASLLHHEAFQVASARLREGGASAWITATFTPKGLAHWTYDVFGTHKPGTFLVQAATADNPFLAAEFLALVGGQYGGQLARQELGGLFVEADESFQIIPTAWAMAAQQRWTETPPEGSHLDALGVDVARGGADQTVIAPRRGRWFARLLKYPGKSTPDGPAVAQLVIAALKDNPKALVNIDLDGPGGSPFDWLKRLLPGVRIMGVRGGGKVEATDRTGLHSFYNVRAFGYWSMRELLDPAHKVGVMLPPDPELLADLTAPRWEITTQGIKVEPKEDIIKRIGRSPDCGDAVVYSILLPPGNGGGAMALRS